MIDMIKDQYSRGEYSFQACGHLALGSGEKSRILVDWCVCLPFSKWSLAKLGVMPSNCGFPLGFIAGSDYAWRVSCGK